MEDIIDLSNPISQASNSDVVPTPVQTIENSKSLIRCDIKMRTSKRIEALKRAGRAANYKSPRRQKNASVAKKTAKVQTKKKKSCNYRKDTKKSRRSVSETDSTRFVDAQSQTENAGPVPTVEATPLHPAHPRPVQLHVPMAAAVPVANAYYPPAPPRLSFYQRLMSLTERIALNPDNQVLDPSDCPCMHCPYSTGMLSLQRYNLMVRTFQINYVMNSQPHVRDQWS